MAKTYKVELIDLELDYKLLHASDLDAERMERLRLKRDLNALGERGYKPTWFDHGIGLMWLVKESE